LLNVALGREKQMDRLAKIWNSRTLTPINEQNDSHYAAMADVFVQSLLGDPAGAAKRLPYFAKLLGIDATGISSREYNDLYQEAVKSFAKAVERVANDVKLLKGK